MNMKKDYTKVMHLALKNALKNNQCLEYNLKNTGHGQFIKFIKVTKEGVRFRYNTQICVNSSVAKEKFLNYTYEEIIADLEKSYNHSINNSLYNLESEYYNDNCYIPYEWESYRK